MVPSPASKRKSSRRLPSYLRKSGDEPVGELRRLREEARNAARERDGRTREPSSSSRGPLMKAAEATGTPEVRRQKGLMKRSTYLWLVGNGRMVVLVLIMVPIPPFPTNPR